MHLGDSRDSEEYFYSENLLVSFIESAVKLWKGKKSEKIIWTIESQLPTIPRLL